VQTCSEGEKEMLKETLVSRPQKTTLKNKPNLSSDFEKAAADVLATTRKELQAAAKAHGVKIRAEQMVCANLEKTMIAHAPIAGIERYTDADFAAGAPIQLVLIKSTTRGEIPSGSYVVKAQYQPRAASGKAIFIDRNGVVVRQRELIVRTWKQSAVLFPDVYTDPGPQLIPVVTSTHVWHNNKWSVDCAGWIPYRVVYY
jgi:hypothetical protein